MKKKTTTRRQSIKEIISKKGVKIEPQETAKLAGLVYSSDKRPGYTRKRSGKKYCYFNSQGEQIKEESEIQRINKLAIPPAYKDVWICPNPLGHLQATGIDDRGRKQYRYHSRWRKVADETKYNRILSFALALPKIRQRVSKDLSKSGLSREKVLAVVVKLLETTLIRVGNEEYAKENKSFGLTTLRNRHVKIKQNKLEFSFLGKSGVDHTIALNNPRLAKIVKKIRDLPGHDLFQYKSEDDEIHSISSTDVNDYLQQISGESFTAKDFRTWAGTTLAAIALKGFETFDSEAAAKKNIVAAIEQVSKRLGNTPSICRKCYVHPIILDAYLEGTMISVLRQEADASLRSDLSKLSSEEAAVVVLLRDRLAKAETN